jgi:hypothetical protein
MTTSPQGFSPQNLAAARFPVKPHWLAETLAWHEQSATLGFG